MWLYYVPWRGSYTRRVGGWRGAIASVVLPVSRTGGNTGQPFSIRPSPNRACYFHSTRLSSIAVMAPLRMALTSSILIICRLMGRPA